MAKNPVQEIIDMRKQGISDNLIVQQLQQQGIPTQNIFDAMSQADLSGMSSQGYPSAESQMPQMEAPPMQFEQPAYSEQRLPDEHIQEVAEAVVNEKFDEIVSEVRKVAEWKDLVELELQKLKESIDALKNDMNQLRQGVLGKVSEYDANMRDVSSELKAVHKVFKEVLPSFTENVAELSELTKKVKKQK